MFQFSKEMEERMRKAMEYSASTVKEVRDYYGKYLKIIGSRKPLSALEFSTYWLSGGKDIIMAQIDERSASIKNDRDLERELPVDNQAEKVDAP